MTVHKGMVLVDQHGTEWVAISDPDDTGRFRCGNEYGMGWGNVNVVVTKDPESPHTLARVAL